VSRVEINHDLCNLCELCVQSCPFDALSVAGDKIEVGDECTLCGKCIEECPVEAITLVEEREVEAADLSGYRGVWVFGERKGAGLHPVVLELVGKGRELADQRGSFLAVVLLGETDEKLEPALDVLRRFPVDRVYVVEAPELGACLSETHAAALAELIRRESPEIVLSGATAMGRSFIPRVAGLVKTGLTADCTGLEIDAEQGLLRQTRPAFGGNIMATILCPRHRPQMATVRPKVFPSPEPGEVREVEVVTFRPSADALECAVQLIERRTKEEAGESIAEADVIVSGGRGVGSAEGFRLIEELARELGGAVGASRAVVDAGWMPYPHQVGQTGKTVQPKLYVACGISGAVQHLVGMQSAGAIIAVNKDPGAPIFKVADVGLVGDLHVIVPRLIEAIRRRKEARG